jgi:hypothetical protein
MVPQGTHISTLKFANLIMEQLLLFYIFDVNQVKLVFCSDGALAFRRIRTHLGKEFKTSYFILDKFHAYDKINKAFPKYKKQSKQCNKFKKLFKTGNYDELINFKPKTIKQKELLKYFIIHKEGIINQAQSFNIGCSAEADVSYLKSLFGNQKKAFAIDVFIKIKTF